MNQIEPSSPHRRDAAQAGGYVAGGDKAGGDDVCWVLTTGEAGMTNQALGLAEAVGLPHRLFVLHLPAPWRWLPGWITAGVLSAVRAEPEGLRPPWPRLVISCGRRSTHVALAIRRASGGRTVAVHIQDPQISPHHFDLVVPPRHDGLEGPNVLATTGAIHRVTPEKLEQGRAAFAETLGRRAVPRVGVLLGGNSRTVRYDRALMERLAGLLRRAVERGGSVLITPSRRTPPDAVETLRKGLEGRDHWIWDGTGENPYFGILGLCDHIVVSGDSVSMVTEACATGRPVYVFDVGGSSKRLLRFHEDLRSRAITRPFDGTLAEWSYPPVNDTPAVARAVRQRLGLEAG